MADTGPQFEATEGYSSRTPKRRPTHAERRFIVLVDRRPLTREGIAKWMEANCKNVRVLAIAEPAELAEAETAGIVADVEIGLFLLNIAGAGMDEPHVVDAIEALKLARPGTPVIVLSDQEEPGAIIKAIEHGLRGYIPTSLDLNLLVEALRFIEAGGTFVPTDLLLECTKQLRATREQDVRESPDHVVQTGDLTPRELEVLALMHFRCRRARSRSMSGTS